MSVGKQRKRNDHFCIGLLGQKIVNSRQNGVQVGQRFKQKRSCAAGEKSVDDIFIFPTYFFVCQFRTVDGADVCADNSVILGAFICKLIACFQDTAQFLMGNAESEAVGGKGVGAQQNSACGEIFPMDLSDEIGRSDIICFAQP